MLYVWAARGVYACFMHAVVGPLIHILVPNVKEPQSSTIRQGFHGLPSTFDIRLGETNINNKWPQLQRPLQPQAQPATATTTTAAARTAANAAPPPPHCPYKGT